MRLTVGYVGDGPGGRRLWAPISVRHFERRGLLAKRHAQEALQIALDKGYIKRFPRGKRGYLYAVNWEKVNYEKWCTPKGIRLMYTKIASHS